MSLQRSVYDYPFEADYTVAQASVVSWSPDTFAGSGDPDLGGNGGITSWDGTNPAIGVCVDAIVFDLQSQQIIVRVAGIASVYVQPHAQTIHPGDFLMPDASGGVLKWTGPLGTANPIEICGIALTGAPTSNSDLQMIDMLIRPHILGTT